MKRIYIVLPVIILGLTAIFFSNNSNAVSHPIIGQPNVPPTDIFGVLLRDGDLIGASTFGDPDIYIVNTNKFFEGVHVVFNGAKRLFLNPTIFSFYGHLGGFGNVRPVTPAVRDSFQTSGLFRNCETNAEPVWAVEVTGEDIGIFHHVQVSGPQAVIEDPNFFKKVFCINSNEERWYAKSIFPYTRLADIPQYSRFVPPTTCRGEGESPLFGQGEPQCCSGLEVVTEATGDIARLVCRQPRTCVSEGQPIDATAQFACCSGLVDGTTLSQGGVDLSTTDLTKAVCVRPGCYYQEIACVTIFCNPILVCPTQNPVIREFTITADDSSFEASDVLAVQKGDLVRLTFNVRTTNVSFGGLDFRSNVVNTGTILPGGSKTVEYTANDSVFFQSYWPGSGVMKPYTILVSITVE